MLMLRHALFFSRNLTSITKVTVLFTRVTVMVATGAVRLESQSLDSD
jgi:hypothetical protein